MASGVSGITSSTGSSGLDVTATVDALMQVERAPERLLQNQQQKLNNEASAFRDIQTRVTSLINSVDALKDVSGAFSGRVTSVSQAGVLAATADETAKLGSHVLSVESLASYGTWYSDPVNGGAFAAGAMSVQVGGAAPITFTFDSSHVTLDKAAEYINAQAAGVTASVIKDANGAHLALISSASGKAGDISVLQSPTGLVMHRGTTGANAKVVVDGVPIESATNSVSGAITGVTLDLLSASPGTQVTLGVKADSEKARTAIETLVANFNSVVGMINANFTYNAQTKSAGVLAGDSSLRNIQSTLLDCVSYSVAENPSFASLSALGIDMKDDGSLQINSSELDDALSKHFVDVESFFRSAGSVGFAANIGKKLSAINDSIDGPLAVSITGRTKNADSIQDQIDAMEVRLETRRQMLLDQYSKIDTMLRQFSQTQAQLTAQLGSLK